MAKALALVLSLEQLAKVPSSIFLGCWSIRAKVVALTAQTLKLTQQYLHGVKHASAAADALATEL